MPSQKSLARSEASTSLPTNTNNNTGVDVPGELPRHPSDPIHPFQLPLHKDKKRNLFGFLKNKKNQYDIGGSSNMNNNNDSASILAARKKSRDYENTLYNQDMLTVDDMNRQYVGERKKSGSSNNSKGKERKRSEGSIYFLSEESKNDKGLALDQDFNSMDGIINPEYRNGKPVTSTSDQDAIVDPSWAPPDSWAVQADEIGEEIHTPALFDKDSPDYLPVVEHENWNIPSKNYFVRIFKFNGTFNTLVCPLNITTESLIQKLAIKFFLDDLSKYNLILIRHNNERILQPLEHPIQLQKTILEQIGYTEEDKIEDVGREDNTYLFRFLFCQNSPNTIHEEELTFNTKIELQNRNLTTIPIFLYKSATRIASLDLSKNLLMEIPTDFLQMCKSLKLLWLINNGYKALPPSIRLAQNLEHLNISGNHILELESAHLEDLKSLKSLRAYNNQLTIIPQGFSTFKHLDLLSISNNSFTKFPKVICEISTLSYLDISFNKISSFPDEISNLTQLIKLLATANRLTGSLPPSFSKLVSLQELDIRQNQITDLDELYNLPKLEIISVDYNAISVVNYGFRNLSKLKMSKNHLTQFNLSPSHLRNPDGTPATHACLLTELNLANCKLTSLADDLFLRAENLEILILDNNSLTILPSSIGALKKLVDLSVQGNYLETIPSEISNLSELKNLYAQKNNLKSLPKEIWLCASLQILNCSSNLLDTFPEPFSVPNPVTPVTEHAPSLPPKSLFTQNLNAGQGIVFSPSTAEDNNYTTPSTADDDTPIPAGMLSSGFHPPPNFNPPSFFSNPRNHPPPLSLSLRQLLLGDNRFTDDIWSPLSLFIELRTLNLCFNDLYEIPPEGLCHQHLYELYLSGNHLTSLPADDIEKLSYLRVLAVNDNKLQTLPAEIGKLRKLLVLDVGNNVLKYNISNWPYDWNWNWNLDLKYLNLSGNKRLEIKKAHPEMQNPKDKNLSDFSALSKLRMLGLMDVTILGVSTPEEFHDRRVRTSPSEVNGMTYGVADWLGPSNHLATWDLVMPRFRNRDDECLFGLFDGGKQSKAGCKLTRFLNDNMTYHFTNELEKTKNDDTIVSAIRRTFLALEKEFGSRATEDKELGASAVMCYVSGTKLYVANVGDSLAVLSRNNGQVSEISQKHIPLNPSEISRIRAAGGYVSTAGLLNDELNVSRSFGYYNLIPVVNANPFISTINLAENDEFVILASHGLWDCIPSQTAVDIVRTEKDDLMVAAQKLRDFALTYGAKDNIMVMVIGVGDMFDKRDKNFRNLRGLNMGAGRAGVSDSPLMDDGFGTPGIISKNKRRIKDESPSDSTLARLDREVPPPINQVALVFTDIKSSTLLWDTQPEDMRSAIKIHDAVMRRTLRSIGGYEVKTEGDAFMVCFQDVISALLWCFTVQLQLLEVDWPAGILETEEGREITKDTALIYRGLSVRMGIHLGAPVYERNPITKRMDYFGPVVNKASRICNAADGGQICVSSDVITALREMPGVFGDDKVSSAVADSTTSRSLSRYIQQIKRLGFHVVELGERRLKGLETPEMLCLIYPKQLSGRIEVEKSEVSENTSPIISTATPQNENMLEMSPLYEASLSYAPEQATPSLDVGGSHEASSFFQPASAPLKPPPNRQIDPAFVMSLNNLAVRLESITTGSVSAETLIDPEVYKRVSTPTGLTDSLGLPTEEKQKINSSNYSVAFNRRMQEVATDGELVMLMENCITRIENATSALYLQKMGDFAPVLEKLSEAVQLDPMHILRALQIYSEISGFTGNHSGV